jgi:hypothetical protein
MPKPTTKNRTVFCTSSARDGKGGIYEIGQKVECETKEAADQLLSSNRFTNDKEIADAAVQKAEDEAKAQAVENSKDAEIAELKKRLAASNKSK